MPKGALRAEIANFVCTVEEKPLLEVFERFYSAISKPKNIEWRKGETYGFRFIDVELKDINGTVYLVGRLVKKILHVASQNLDEEVNKLKKISKKMKDDPSSAFLLRLYDHKIIIVEETRKAPKIKDFENAFKKLLKVHTKELYYSEKEKYKRALKKQRLSPDERKNFEEYFFITYPNFYITITAIATDKDLESIFINAQSINKYRIKIPHSNDEDSNVKNTFLKALDKTRVVAGNDKSTSGEYTLKDNQIGLDKNFIKDMTKDVAKSGGTFGFHLTGKTKENEQLNVSEENIKVTYYVDATSDLNLLALNATSKFQKLVKEGSVKLSKILDENEMLIKAKAIFNKLKK